MGLPCAESSGEIRSNLAELTENKKKTHKSFFFWEQIHLIGTKMQVPQIERVNAWRDTSKYELSLSICSLVQQKEKTNLDGRP